MKLTEAFSQIEGALTALGLRDRWGALLMGIEAAGVVGKKIGPIWDECENDLENGRISPAQYASRMIELIRRFSSERFNKKVIAKINDLRCDQVELDLLSK